MRSFGPQSDTSSATSSAGADAAVLARFVATAMHGMAVQAASGASRKELRRVGALFLRAWPS